MNKLNKDFIKSELSPDVCEIAYLLGKNNLISSNHYASKTEVTTDTFANIMEVLYTNYKASEYVYVGDWFLHSKGFIVAIIDCVIQVKYFKESRLAYEQQGGVNVQ